MEKSRETELTRISRELIYLQSNLQKKQKKLKSVLVEKDAEIAARDSKIEELTRRLLERQGPNSTEEKNSACDLALKNRLIFKLVSVTCKYYSFFRFLIVGNPKPKLKPFFKPKFKPKFKLKYFY